MVLIFIMLSLYQHLIPIRIRICTICTRAMSSHNAKAGNHPTAGIIVIGDEILKAQVRDTNSYHMCSLLYKCGVKVKKISVISDSVEEISKEIRNASGKFTYVITSGGIGPTHDDVTFEGLAKAFDDTLHYHPKLVDIIKNQFGAKDPLSPAYKMALIPKKASLKFNLNMCTGRPNAYPYIVLENVYVFPGSPVFFERSFQGLYEDLLSTTNKKFVKDEVFINAREEAFTNALSTVVKEFPNVSFGSYPVSNCRYYKAFVTIESDNANDTENATQRFRELNPADIFVKFDRTPHIDCVTKYNNFLHSCSHRRLIYEQLLEELRQFYRDPESVSIRMDGGVESSIVIHFAHICKVQSDSNDKLRAVYFKEKQTSIHLEEFIKEMTDKYNLAVCTMEAEPDKSINELISVQAHLRTLLVGKAGEDGVNEVNCMCYAGASNADRLQINNPLRNWTNEDVWFFASSLSLPYVTTTMTTTA